jgi:hypothetical protein
MVTNGTRHRWRHIICRLIRRKSEPEPSPIDDIIRLLKGEAFGSVPPRRPDKSKSSIFGPAA